MKKLLLSIVFCLFPACVLLSAETEQDEPGMAEDRIDSCDILWKQPQLVFGRALQKPGNTTR